MKYQDIPSQWITPDWSAPKNIKAIMTTRQGGYSQAPFDSMNLGDHVDDDRDCVKKNRAYLKQVLDLPRDPLWLNQVHGTTVVNVDHQPIVKHKQEIIDADAEVAYQTGSVCAVMTADCLPVLFCNQQGTAIAAAHAGWRGLQAGVLEATVATLSCPTSEVMAWLGVAISPKYFEVGHEVRAAFMLDDHVAKAAFVPSLNEGKWFADIYHLARLRLSAVGVTQIYGGGECTFNSQSQFYSYRRVAKTGRMASLVWMI